MTLAEGIPTASDTREPGVPDQSRGAAKSQESHAARTPVGAGLRGGGSEGRRGAGEGPSGRRCLSIAAFGWQVRRDDGPDSGQAQMVSGVAGASLTWCLSFLPF